MKTEADVIRAIIEAERKERNVEIFEDTEMSDFEFLWDDF